MSEQQLKMTFEPRTIEHLGVRMYSTIPPVLAELISNAYDADAEKVTLTLKDEEEEKEIIIEDDGIGMSFDEINDKFLRIGRDRRSAENTDTTTKGRKVIGKKGLGKLSFFGIANEVEIRTCKDGKENIFIMNWEDIRTWEDIKKSPVREYQPEIIGDVDRPCSSDEHGTTIILRGIKRKTEFSAEQIAESISRMFVIESDFNIGLIHNNKAEIEISNDMRFNNIEIEFKWEMPAGVNIASEYDKAGEIKGLIITAESPIPQKTNMRGIILFSRGKLVNAPDYFSDSSTSSYFFSYLTGYLHVDFIDDMSEEVISTNRQSLIWENEEMVKLRKHLEEIISYIQRDWRKKKREAKKIKLKETLKIDTDEWYRSLPDAHGVKRNVKMAVSKITESELSTDASNEIVGKIHDLVPEYPQYHWRYLHKSIKKAAKFKYENKDYYGAARQALMRYARVVRTKSGITDISDQRLMGTVFDPRDPILSVVQNIVESIDYQFDPLILESIQSGHRLLSKGAVAGFRNPMAHEEEEFLEESGLLTEEDCLNILSLLSHLFRRLDKAKKVK